MDDSGALFNIILLIGFYNNPTPGSSFTPAATDRWLTSGGADHLSTHIPTDSLRRPHSAPHKHDANSLGNRLPYSHSIYKEIYRSHKNCHSPHQDHLSNREDARRVILSIIFTTRAHQTERVCSERSYHGAPPLP